MWGSLLSWFFKLLIWTDSLRDGNWHSLELVAESRSLLKVGEGFRQAKSHINILWVHLWIDDPWLIHRTVSYFKVMMMAVTSRETGFHLEALAVEHHIYTYLHTYGDTTWRVWMFICFDQHASLFDVSCTKVSRFSFTPFHLTCSSCPHIKVHQRGFDFGFEKMVQHPKFDVLPSNPNSTFWLCTTLNFDVWLRFERFWCNFSTLTPVDFKRKGRDGGLGPGRGRGRARLPGITGMGWMMLWLQVEKPT